MKRIPADVVTLAIRAQATVLDACDPERLVETQWRKGIGTDGPVWLIAFGKASVAMTFGAREMLGDRLQAGMVLAPPELAPLLHDNRLDVYPVDHPLPTERNVVASEAVKSFAERIPPDGQVLVLISGGGSSHLTLPNEGVTLAEIQARTLELQRSGAAIGELNRVRQGLEQLKAGGLARILSPRPVRAVVLSDVIGDSPAVIASGPLIDDKAPITHHTIGSNDLVVDAIQEFLGEDRCSALPNQVGSASEAGAMLAKTLNEGDAKFVVLGGETTVDVGESNGVGGPAMELAMTAALALPEDRSWGVWSFATDGVDGPTDAAGTLLCSELLKEAAAREAAIRSLERHDTYPLLDRLGALVRTGPTGSNVNDLAIAWWRDVL